MHSENSPSQSWPTNFGDETKFSLLDKVRSGVMADKNAVYYELLSIGQYIVQSRDVRQLRRHLRARIGRPLVLSMRADSE